MAEKVFCIICQAETDSAPDYCLKPYWMKRKTAIEESKERYSQRRKILRDRTNRVYEDVIGYYEGNIDLCLRAAADE